MRRIQAAEGGGGVCGSGVLYGSSGEDRRRSQRGSCF